MLAKAPMTTILPVVDLSHAREFYERKLGLVPTGERPDGKFVYTAAAVRRSRCLRARPRRGPTARR